MRSALLSIAGILSVSGPCAFAYPTNVATLEIGTMGWPFVLFYTTCIVLFTHLHLAILSNAVRDYPNTFHFFPVHTVYPMISIILLSRRC